MLSNSYKSGLTAVAGGGQSTAATIGNISGQGDSAWNRFTTVASANDSATLPPASPGLQYTVANAAAANSMNVFPFPGDAINILSANTALAVAAGKTAIFQCMAQGFWNANLSA